MSQLISVRSNHDFGLNFKDSTLVPQTELILLVKVPRYGSSPEGDIHVGSEVKELRFKCGEEGVKVLIDQLNMALKNIEHFKTMGDALNEIISKSPPPAGEIVKRKED